MVVGGNSHTDPVGAFAFSEAAVRLTDLVAVQTWRTVSPARFESDGPVIDWAAVRADEERFLSEPLRPVALRWPRAPGGRRLGATAPPDT